MTKGFNYRLMMLRAMHGVVAEVLARVARDGLPGDHHLFIKFDTTHPGVDMSPQLKERYPEDMIIVLQHMFSDLAVMKDRFTVTLRFGNVAETIVVPFEAMKTFADPSVNFGLGFEEVPAAEAGSKDRRQGADASAIRAASEGGVVSLDKFRKH
jgi:uncharacterized protein